MLWGKNREKWKGRQPPGVEPRTPLACTYTICICTSLYMCSTYRGFWALMVVQLSWLSGRALAAQAIGVLGSTPGSCQPFAFLYVCLITSKTVRIKTTWAEKKRFTVALAAMANRIMQTPSECYLQRAWWNPREQVRWSLILSEWDATNGMGGWLQLNTDTDWLVMNDQSG